MGHLFTGWHHKSDCSVVWCWWHTLCCLPGVCLVLCGFLQWLVVSAWQTTAQCRPLYRVVTDMTVWVSVLVCVSLATQAAAQCSPSPCGVNTNCETNAGGAAICRWGYWRVCHSLTRVWLYVFQPWNHYKTTQKPSDAIDQRITVSQLDRMNHVTHVQCTGSTQELMSMNHIMINWCKIILDCL